MLQEAHLYECSRFHKSFAHGRDYMVNDANPLVEKQKNPQNMRDFKNIKVAVAGTGYM